ncbi:pseudouridine synthase [Phosphitispora sp. TUW77]|uniref:pseudouridine synthase n=1 Tax=Phosphitispora sp. TUW77 TaxID=3152361 RepID=UPI003AB4944E
MKDKIRLDKLLANSGFGTRKEIKKAVREGRVTVNGITVTDSSFHVHSGQDTVVFDGVVVEYREFVYLMLNKPAGYVSATVDPKQATVIELVPERFRHFELFPVGRLDKDTEGLLILTNDGKLAHELLAPKKHVPKTYFVKVNGRVSPGHGKRFAEGVILDDGYKTMPARLSIVHSGDVSEAEVTIHEGKYHQVKRMFAALGLPVVYLKRIAMGNLSLDESLAPGDVRELSTGELTLLRP